MVLPVVIAAVAISLIAGVALDNILSKGPEEVIKSSTTIINSTMTNIFQRHSVDASSVFKLENSIRIRSEGADIYCPTGKIKIDQSISSNVKIVTEVKSEMIAEITEAIATNIEK